MSDPSWTTCWDRFWFAPKPQAILTIMRMSYGAYLIFYFWNVQPVLKMFFGTNGLVSLGGRFPQQPSPIPTIFTVLSDKSDAVVWLVTLLGMFSGAILTTGIFNRIAPLLAWICVSSVVTAIPVNSGDFLVQCYAMLMVFAGLAGHLGKPVWQCSTGEHPAWSLRLFQIQIVFVYFFSGWHKLASTAWHNGSAFHYVISQEFWSRFDITWLAAYPVFTSALTTFVLFFELLLFPVLIWVPATRRLMLGCGLIFHLMIFATLKVFVFHQIVILFYLAFLTSDDISQFKNHLESVLKKRIPTLSNALRSWHK
ncbi:HTTM domain-containing protein [Pirellulales bacterium]|nr:HTTM domain-containing protein [Pirellulales bacterium]